MSAAACIVDRAVQEPINEAPPSDSQCFAVLKAEHELASLAAWFGALNLTDVTRQRLNEGIDAIREGLNVRRRALGLRPRDPAVTA